MAVIKEQRNKETKEQREKVDTRNPCIMPHKMKTVTIQGVPYSVSGENLYIYGTQTQIGTYKNDVLTLFDNWDKSQEVLTTVREYRNKLKEQTTVALAKAAELQAS